VYIFVPSWYALMCIARFHIFEFLKTEVRKMIELGSGEGGSSPSIMIFKKDMHFD